jgi:hypothetical protein
MRRRLGWAVALVTPLLVAPCARAAEVALGATLGSARVWRGITFNTTPVLEPHLYLRTGGRVPAVFGVRGTVDIGDEGGAFDAEGFSELTLSATLELPLGLRASYIELLYPGPRLPRGFRVTREVAFGWLWSGIVEPGVMIHYDVDSVDSYFVEAYLGRTFALSERTRLTLEAEAGHAAAGFAAVEGIERGGLHHYDVGARVVFRPTADLDLTARAAFAGTFNESLPIQPVGFYATVGVNVRP